MSKVASQVNQVEEGHELQMGLLEHLAELRDRMVRAVLALVIGTVIGFFFATQGLQLLQQPYCQLVESPELCRFQLIGPTDGVLVYLQVALLMGGVLSIPLVTYQVVMFVFPGLTKRERRYVLMALPGVSILFVVGVLFAWLILLPPALGFLEGFQAQLFKPEWTADLYMNFVLSLVFWMGVAFEIPLVFFVLSLLGVIRAGTLARNWRIAVVGSSVAAALITPTIDPVNMFLVMGPLLGLYALSIVLVAIGNRINPG
jgi:sec-independent protein translocase protein TatC